MDNATENKRCKVCHNLRSAENIGTLTYRPMPERNPEVTAIIRYCKDKPECLAGAKAEAAGREI